MIEDGGICCVVHRVDVIGDDFFGKDAITHFLTETGGGTHDVEDSVCVEDVDESTCQYSEQEQWVAAREKGEYLADITIKEKLHQQVAQPTCCNRTSTNDENLLALELPCYQEATSRAKTWVLVSLIADGIV